MVLYVDTERNQKDQLPYAMQKIRIKAGFPKNQNPEHFDFISLVDIPRAERFDTLKSYIELVQSKFKEYQLIVILDVITDCIENFNDPKESLKLIDLINEQANQKDVTFLCVIHENPSSSEKARGHLGTEIINKASQVIQIGFDSDSKELILLKFLHSRNTKSIDPLYLKYDEDSKGLVEANPNEIKLNHLSKQEKAPLNQVEAWFKRHLIGEMSKKDAYERLMNHFDCKDKTIDDRINSLIENDFLEKSKNQNSVYFKFKINF